MGKGCDEPPFLVQASAVLVRRNSEARMREAERCILFVSLVFCCFGDSWLTFGVNGGVVV